MITFIKNIEHKEHLTKGVFLFSNKKATQLNRI